MSNKRTGVYDLAGMQPESLFPLGQGAHHSQPRLDRNRANSGNMRQPEPGVANPGPAASLAKEYPEQTTDDESDEQQVYEQDGICG